MNLQSTNALLIFVRNPIEGMVKTRIAQSTNNAEALHIYQQLIHITQRNCDAVQNCDKFVFYSNFIPEQPDQWANDRYQKKIQSQSPDLGQRMKQAFDDIFQMKYQQAIIIGSDCPDLTAEHIKNAWQQLTNTDAVVGPASDGGYYLLGIKKQLNCLWTNKQWSSSSVLSDTLNDLYANNWTYQLLPTLNDIDTWQDWIDFCGR